MNTSRSKLKEIALKKNGETDEMLRIWSGDTLMDLAANSALKMTVKQMDGSDCLFIEAGGFGTRNKGQQQPSNVLTRVTK